MIERNFLRFILPVFLLLGCGASKDSEDLQRLKSWMTGSFSSQEQAESDSNFFDIRLQMKQIWPERKDGFWLYVEQAEAENLDKPYRQRVYHLSQLNDSTFKSSVYVLRNPLRFAGTWRAEFPLADLNADSLQKREGCAILIKKRGKFFVGTTADKNCMSNLRGASYATSEVKINENELISWDRGFDENDRQVWGSTVGGYIFKKIEDY